MGNSGRGSTRRSTKREWWRWSVRAVARSRQLASSIPSATAIRHWVEQADRDEGLGKNGLTMAERREVREVKREPRRVKLRAQRIGKSSGLVPPGEWIDPPRAARFVKRSTSRVSGARDVPPAGALPQAATTRGGSGSCRLVGRARTRCSLSGSSRSTPWAWGAYGAPRVHAELRGRGRAVSVNRVARLMRAGGDRRPESAPEGHDDEAGRSVQIRGRSGGA